jgi:hypothetical protein
MQQFWSIFRSADQKPIHNKLMKYQFTNRQIHENTTLALEHGSAYAIHILVSIITKKKKEAKEKDINYKVSLQSPVLEIRGTSTPTLRLILPNNIQYSLSCFKWSLFLNQNFHMQLCTSRVLYPTVCITVYMNLL